MQNKDSRKNIQLHKWWKNCVCNRPINRNNAVVSFAKYFVKQHSINEITDFTPVNIQDIVTNNIWFWFWFIQKFALDCTKPQSQAHICSSTTCLYLRVPETDDIKIPFHFLHVSHINATMHMRFSECRLGHCALVIQCKHYQLSLKTV